MPSANLRKINSQKVFLCCIYQRLLVYCVILNSALPFFNCMNDAFFLLFAQSTFDIPLHIQLKYLTNKALEFCLNSYLTFFTSYS